MAKIITGGIVAKISGALGPNVYSHNRFGAYIRARVTPTVSTTAPALAQKARLTNLSQAWQSLTATQRLAWKEWALNNPTTDRIGQQQHLTGHQSYIALNSRILQVGDAAKTDPPIAAPPAPLLSSSLSLDIGAGSFGLTFTPTPLGAAEKLWLRCAVTDSAGINYVSNILRVTGVSAAAQASPYDFQTDIESVFGTLVVGNVVNVWAHVFDQATGQLSAPVRLTGTVVST
jgi:hypothetical protein